VPTQNNTTPKINQPSLSFSPTLHESNSVKESKKRILSPQKCIFFDFKQHSAAEVSQPKKFLKSSSTNEISKVLFQEKENILPTQKISTDAQKVSKNYPNSETSSLSPTQFKGKSVLFNFVEFKTPKTRKDSRSQSISMLITPLKKFEKDNKKKGRPSISADTIDVLADLQSKCHVSATQSGLVIDTIQKKLFKGYSDEPLSPQSALRALTIKGLAGDFVFAKTLSSSVDIWIGLDGGNIATRSMIELHFIGRDKSGNNYKQLLNIKEKVHGSAGETVIWICSIMDYINRLQTIQNVKETYIYVIQGIVFDTTSENTGLKNGIGVLFEVERQRRYVSDQNKKKIVNYLPLQTLIQKSCCDHVAHLGIVNFRKSIVDVLQRIDSELVTTSEKTKEFILFPLLKSLGNFIGKGEEKTVLTNQIKLNKKITNVLINPINEVRYLSMCNLCEVVVDHWDIVLNFIHDHLKANNWESIQNHSTKTNLLIPFQH
jgi:hypothetical protein